MKHFIDPTIDVVFATIFGSEHNKPTLIHFLNSVLHLEKPITNVRLTNTISLSEHLLDKKTIVDILATDGDGYTYQIEMQTTTPSYLTHRMLYNWADLYQAQIRKGEQFSALNPVISIWVLSNALFRDINVPHLHFTFQDSQHGVALNDHAHIHVLQLDKWVKPKTLQAEDLWLYSLKEGKHWKELPEELRHIPAFEAFMSTLNDFSDRDIEYDLYRRRAEYQRILVSDEAEKADALKKALEANMKLAMAETRAETAETRAETAETRAETAETRAETAETRAEAAEAAISQEKIRAEAAILQEKQKAEALAAEIERLRAKLNH